ncbi:MAG: hypothetical protein WCJ30_26520 [Deltaproteobacteria bacterium]
MTQARGGALWVVAALVFGILFVWSYDALLAPVRYPYAADSASYIEMADTLAHEGRPRVTPWDLEFPDRDRIPQRLFPPGFALVVAAFLPLAGDAASAALWPGRLAAALLPVLLLLAFRGVLADRTLALVGALAHATPGVRGWQFLAYSDVTALAVALLALGALAHGLGLAGASAPRPAVPELAYGDVPNAGSVFKSNQAAALRRAFGRSCLRSRRPCCVPGWLRWHQR